MQISKNLFVVFAMALLICAPSLRARETDAQAKAREELRKKMSELDAQEKGARSPAPTPPPARTPPPAVAPAPAQPAVVEVAPAPAVPAQPVAAPVPARGDDEATARARAALREKMRELDAQKASTRAPAPPAQVVAPTPAPQPVAPVAAPAPAPAPVAAPIAQSTFAPTGQPEDEATARTRAALRQKMAELDAQQLGGRPAAAYAGPVAQPSPEFKPITAPPLPISGPKEMRLAELLRQYKADLITPNVYHKERAKILAEP